MIFCALEKYHLIILRVVDIFQCSKQRNDPQSLVSLFGKISNVLSPAGFKDYFTVFQTSLRTHLYIVLTLSLFSFCIANKYCCEAVLFEFIYVH